MIDNYDILYGMAIRRMTYRLYPTATQEKELYGWRRMHKDLYNAALYNRKTQYEKFGHSVDYFEQQNCLPAFKEVWVEYKALGSHALQATLKRVDMAYQRFFKRLGGYPKFKSIRHYSGWAYPDVAGWKAHTTGDNGSLEISNLGQLQMRGKAKVWGTPTTCTIVYRGGKWYASITINCEPVARVLGTGAIGIDFGTNMAAAISDGENGYFIENPRWFKQALPKIKLASREKCRKRSPNNKKKIKASGRWKRATRKVAKLQRKSANQRQNWVHHQAIQITSGNSLVASEKLEVKNMTRKAKSGSKRKRQKAGLNRSILDVGWGMFSSAIKYKLEESDGIFVEVPTKKVKPSQTCPKCLHQKKKELDERTHNCQKCGYIQDRDLAAASVMILWATNSGAFGTSVLRRGASSSTSIPKERKHCGGMRQLGAVKRQKHHLADGDSETPSSRSRVG